jgi:hypothetical protein
MKNKSLLHVAGQAIYAAKPPQLQAIAAVQDYG